MNTLKFSSLTTEDVQVLAFPTGKGTAPCN